MAINIDRHGTRHTQQGVISARAMNDIGMAINSDRHGTQYRQP